MNQMRVYADMESVFHGKAVSEAAAQMLVSKYGVKEILPEMRKIGELQEMTKISKLVADNHAIRFALMFTNRCRALRVLPPFQFRTVMILSSQSMALQSKRMISDSRRSPAEKALTRSMRPSLSARCS